MPIQPRQSIVKDVDDQVDVEWDSAGTRMILHVLATDGTGIALSIAPELARMLQEDIAQTIRERPAGAPER